MNDDGGVERVKFPVAFEAKKVNFEILSTGELQTTITLDGGNEVCQVSQIPDGVYDQLMEMKNAD